MQYKDRHLQTCIKMTTHIYHYPYGHRFRFINTGNFVMPDNVEYTVAYNMDTKRVVVLCPMIAEHCQVVDDIDDKTLTYEMLDALECNLGFSSIPSSKLHYYLKYHDECRQQLCNFISAMVAKSWSSNEAKELLSVLKMDSVDSKIINIFEKSIAI